MLDGICISDMITGTKEFQVLEKRDFAVVRI